jgi:hypothetical protein
MGFDSAQNIQKYGSKNQVIEPYLALKTEILSRLLVFLLKLSVGFGKGFISILSIF